MTPADDSNTLPGIQRNLLAGAQDGTLGYWKAAQVLDSYLENGANALLNQEAWEAFTAVPMGPDARRGAWDARLILMLSDSMSLYARTAGKDQKEAILGNPKYLAQALVWTWLTRSTWAVPDPDPALIAKVVSATVRRINPVLRKHLDAALDAALECKDPWRLEVAKALRAELPWEFLYASYPEDDTLDAARMVEGTGFHLPHSHPGSRITIPFGDYLPRLIQAVLARNLSREEAQQRWDRAVRLWDEEMAAGRAPFEKFYFATGFLEGIPSKVGDIADSVRFVRLWLAMTLDTSQSIYPRDLQMLVSEDAINYGMSEWAAIMAGLPVGMGVRNTVNFDDLLKLAETKAPTPEDKEVASRQESLKAIMDPNADPKKVGKQGSAATMVLYVKEDLWTPQRAVEFWLDEKAEPLAKPAAASHDRKVFDHDFVLAWLRTGEALTDALTADGHPDPRALRKSLMDFMLPMAGWVQSDIISKAVAQWDNEIQPKIEKAQEVVAKPVTTPADTTGSSMDKTVSSAVTITLPGEQSPLASMRGLLTDQDVEHSAAIVYAVRRGHWTRDQAVEWWAQKRGVEGFPLLKLHHERKDPTVFNLEFARTWFDLSGAITDRMEADGIKTREVQKMLTRRFLQPILKWVDRETVLQAEVEWVENNRTRKAKAAVDNIVASATNHHNREYLPVILASLGTRGGYGLSWDEARKIWGNRANLPASWYRDATQRNPDGTVDLNANMVRWMLGFASTLDNPKEVLRLDLFSELDLKEGIRNFVKSNWVYAMGPSATSNGVKHWGQLMPAVAAECPDVLRWVANHLEGHVDADSNQVIATNIRGFLGPDPGLVAGPEFAKDFLGIDIDSNEDLYETGAALLLILHAREITMDVAVARWRDAVLFSKGVIRLPEGTKPMDPAVFSQDVVNTGLDLFKRLQAADAALSVEPLKEAMRKWVGPNLTEMVLDKSQGIPMGRITYMVGGPRASGKSPGANKEELDPARRTTLYESAAQIVYLRDAGLITDVAAQEAWLGVCNDGNKHRVSEGVTPRHPGHFNGGLAETWMSLGMMFKENGVVTPDDLDIFAAAMLEWVDPDILAEVGAKRFGPPATGGLTEDQALEAAAVLAVATHAANTRYARQQAVKIWSEPTIPRRQLGELRVHDREYMVGLGRTWLEILKEMPEGWARTDLFRKSMEKTLGSDVVEEASASHKDEVSEPREPTSRDLDRAIILACRMVHGGSEGKTTFEEARAELASNEGWKSDSPAWKGRIRLMDPKDPMYNEDVVEAWVRLTTSVSSLIRFSPFEHLRPWVKEETYLRGMDLYRHPKTDPASFKTRGMIAVETLKDDAREIALRTGVRRIRSLARARLSAWWAKATTPRGATESQDAWEARVRSVEATHGAFLGTDAGEAAMAMLLGFTWTAVSADVDGDQMRAFGDAVARELRVSAGSDIVEGFMDEVVGPVVRNLRSAPEAAFSTNVRVVADAPATEDSDGVTQAEPAARTAHR